MRNGYSIRSVEARDKEYPELLRNITGAPSLLYYRGTLPGKREKPIAIVGTRKATREGRLLAKRIAEALAERGCTVVSGLALGIDAAAHEGALAGGGKTVAVLANGLDAVHPAKHESLAPDT